MYIKAVTKFFHPFQCIVRSGNGKRLEQGISPAIQRRPEIQPPQHIFPILQTIGCGSSDKTFPFQFIECRKISIESGGIRHQFGFDQAVIGNGIKTGVFQQPFHMFKF